MTAPVDPFHLPSASRALRPAAFAAAFLCVAGCASSPPDLVRDACPPTELRLDSPALTSCVVRLVGDARPVAEHGKESFLGESRIPDQAFRAPVPEALLRVFARDLRVSKLFRLASLSAADPDFRLEVMILHATASYTEGIPSLVPVLPTSSVRAKLALRLVFADRDGRVYMDRVFEQERTRASAAVEGLASTAAALLGDAMRVMVDEAVREMRAAYDGFWAKARGD